MHNILKNKKWLLAIGTVFAILLFSFVLYSSSFAEVNLTINNDTKTLKTRSITVGEFIEENDIYIGNSDYINLDKDEKIEDGIEILVKRSKSVTIKIGDQLITKSTYESSVENILKALDIEFDMDDKINPGLSSTYEEGEVINLTRVEKKEVVEEENIEYSTLYRDNKNLEIGKTRVVKEGSEGIKEIMKSQLFENGELVEEKVLSEDIVKEPVDEVIDKGKKPKVVASRGRTTNNDTKSNSSSSSSNVQGSKTITMTATAYSVKGTTASGVPSGPGKVAVDPSVIPLGTRLYIESTDGWGSYGNAVAADTGGAINGNKIDLFYSDRTTALRFGRRTVKVHILK